MVVAANHAVLGLTRSDGDRPHDVHLAGGDAADAHAITDLNPQFAGVALTHAELVSYLDLDGRKRDGVLYSPYGHEGVGHGWELVSSRGQYMDLIEARPRMRVL